MRFSLHLSVLLGLFGLLLPASSPLLAQANTHFTHPAIDPILRGQYNPQDYAATVVIDQPATISAQIATQVSEDSLRAYLTTLSSFGNRNTGSDTVSNVFGIGAARRWAFGKFSEFSAANENRLLVSYLQFDEAVCNTFQHRNVCAILPGRDTSARGYVLIEGHFDSRCDDVCDSLCLAYGADDNGSGTVLVMELARVMSQFTFDHTIIFMLTTGEEQGLMGADALADYSYYEGIPVRAVLNNDVIGGIYCGQTASPPGCPGAGAVDSINLRIYSFGGYNSPHKQLARYCKLQYKEMLAPLVSVPTQIQIMSGEDRTGRGGDHIPFRQNGYPAVRHTSANEHGNGSPGPNYTDRQHTSSDSLGIDLDMDGTIDSFYVDFNYLGRNARINGNSAAMIALGPETPTFTATPVGTALAIEMLTATQYPAYRLAVRYGGNDWDSVYTLQATQDTLYGLPTGQVMIISVAAVDADGVESLFSNEINVSLNPTGTIASQANRGVALLQNRPNPFDEQTIITVRVSELPAFREAHILITDASGREIQRIPMTLEMEVNEVNFYHGYHAAGVYFYSLVIDGEVWQSRRMVME